MRIFNRAHVPWFIFVVAATLFSGWLYLGNFRNLPGPFRLPSIFIQNPTGHRSVGGTPIGLIFGATAYAIFIFAGLLGLRKKVVLWRLGTLQRWMRAHIWLTLLTIPLVLFHCGFRMGGPMTTWLWILYVIVMVSGIYGLALQHQLPRIMKERLPAETVYEQIPHIRNQLVAAATKMRDSFKSADRTDSSRGEPVAPAKTDAGAPAPSASKAVTAGSTPMASTSGELSTPTARAKSVTGSTIAAETVAASAPASAPAAPTNAPSVAAGVDRGPAVPSSSSPPASAPTPVSTPASPPGSTTPATANPPQSAPAATVPPSAPPPKPAAPPAPAAAATVVEHDADSEAVLADFLNDQVLPYLSARRGGRHKLGNNRYSEDLFRVVKLRVAEMYRSRVEEIQAWCDERRVLDLQLRLQHWLHGWLFVHVPVSYFLILFTAWHAYVTLFYY